MNKAQKYLIDNSLNDLPINDIRDIDYKKLVYVSDAMMKFSERQSPCKYSCESKAFEIEIRQLKNELEEIKAGACRLVKDTEGEFEYETDNDIVEIVKGYG